MDNYQQQAIEFLKSTGTTLTVIFKEYGTMPNWDDTFNKNRDIYTCVLKNEKHRYRFTFGQSLKDSTGNGGNKPTAYDILACIEKNEINDFQDFCCEYGYDEDSRKAFKTYKAVKREWENVKKLFTPEEIELLQEIN